LGLEGNEADGGEATDDHYDASADMVLSIPNLQPQHDQ